LTAIEITGKKFYKTLQDFFVSKLKLKDLKDLLVLSLPQVKAHKGEKLLKNYVKDMALFMYLFWTY